MNAWDRLLHRLGFHSVERCAQLHIWRWVEGSGWQAAGPWELSRTAERDDADDPSWPTPGLPTGPMEPPRQPPWVEKRLDPPPAPPTEEIRAVRPPGSHRPPEDRIRPPSRPDLA